MQFPSTLVTVPGKKPSICRSFSTPSNSVKSACGLILSRTPVANAIFDAVGARVMQLPMTPARVLEAIKRA